MYEICSFTLGLETSDYTLKNFMKNDYNNNFHNPSYNSHNKTLVDTIHGLEKTILLLQDRINVLGWYLIWLSAERSKNFCKTIFVRLFGINQWKNAF